MDAEDRSRLLALARAALLHSVSRQAALAPNTDDLPSNSILHAQFGAFVSLHHVNGKLRGCVGSVTASAPLARTIAQMTHAAATRDMRFPPVNTEEIGELEIEISVLGSLELVADLTVLVIGRDGLLVTGLGKRGVLLPQVAEEQGWDAETFAQHTCLKAGLSAFSYKDPEVKLYRFTAEVIVDH